MARYGGGQEDFNDEAQRLRAQRAAREALIRKESVYQRELETSAGLESEASRRTTVTRRARAEAADAAAREARTSTENARALRRESQARELDTAAIERNTRARQRAARTNTGRRPVDASRGFGDPLINQAYGLAPEGGARLPSQYALRNQLGIGSYRARDLRTALSQGAAPTGAVPIPVRAAEVALLRSEAALTEANRALANIRKRASASDAERAGALAVRDKAKADVAAARRTVETATTESAARQADARAIQEERAAHERAASAARTAANREASRASGSDLIRHPTLFGKQAYAPIPQRPGPYRDVQESPAALYGSGHAQRMGQVQEEAISADRARAAALQQQAQAQDDAAGRARRMEGVLGGVNKTTREAATIQRLYSDEMHRHGALTAEFIAAAGRGEVSLRQLGNEMAVTIGKFAGWTAAATLIYGAARAISTLGHGAIAAQSGVHQLTRVIRDVDAGQAVNDFNDLSRAFNVDPSTAADAVYRMGQVFHDQASATEAAKAALYSYKTGEVDVASSTQNLIAIVRGFGLSAKDLTAVYDQINQAQNVFGIRIRDTEEGLAKAAGTYRNAGGDLNYLLSLFVGIQKATARSGTEIGTGLSRAVNQFRLPSHQAALEAAGVVADPRNLQRTIESAVRVSKLHPERIHQIAQAVMGNQYARLLEPVLTDDKTFREAQRDTAPDKARGSAQKELAKVLKQVDQQIEAIGNSLQRLGSQIAEAGLFDFAYVLLRGLNLSLGAAEHMLQVFNLLPTPLQHALGLMLQLGIAMKLAGRFGLAGRLESVPGVGAFVNPNQRLRQQALTGIREYQRVMSREMESATQQLTGARVQQEYNKRLYGPQILQHEQAAARGALPAAGSEARKALDARQFAMYSVLRSDEQAAALAQRRVQIAGQMLATAEGELAAVRGASAAHVAATLESRGINVHPGGVRDPQNLGLVTPNQFLDNAAGRGAVVNNSERATRQLERMNRGIIGMTPILGRMGRTGEMIDSGARRLATTASRVSTSFTGSGAGLRRTAGRLDGFVRSLGAFDLALIGLPVAFELHHLLDQAAENAAKQVDAIDALAAPKSTRQLQSNLKAADARAKQEDGFWTRIASRGAIGGFFDLVAHQERFLGIDAESPAEKAAREREQAAASGEELRRIQAVQKRARRRGLPVPQRFAGDIVHDINTVAGDAAAHRISQKEFEESMEQYRREAGMAYYPTKKQARALRAAIANANRVSGNLRDYSKALQELDNKALTSEMDRTAAELALYGGQSARGRRALRQAAVQYNDAIRRYSGKGDAASIKALADAQTKYFQTIDSTVQSDIQAGLLFANSDAERQAVYSRARQTYVNQLTEVRTTRLHRGGSFSTRAARDPASARRLRQAEAELRDQAYQDRQEGRGTAQALQQSQTADPGRQAATAVRFAERQVRDASKTYGRNSRQYRQALTSLNQARQQQAAAVLADVQADNALLLARATGDPVREADAALKAARNTLRTMRQNAAQFDPNQIKQAEADVIRQEKQTSETRRQNALQVAQLQAQITAARAHGDPVAEARAALQAAGAARRSARTQQERLQALLDWINANNQLEDAIKEREQARFDYLASTTTDPVKQANFQVRAARAALRGLRRGTTAWYQAMAQYNQARQNQLQTRIQSREDDIEFDLSMERIDRDQAISRYRAILKGHNLTKQMRRDIMLRIKALQKEAEDGASGFGLRVGNVKLPTVYDVRRAIAGGRQGQAGNRLNFRNNTTVNVRVASGADVEDVFNELDRQLGTTMSSQMRAAGVA